MIYLQYSIRSLYLHKKCQIKHYDFHLLRGHRHSFQIQFKPIAIKLTINHNPHKVSFCPHLLMVMLMMVENKAFRREIQFDLTLKR